MYNARSTLAYHHQDQLTIPIIRRQLNHLAKHERGQSFADFADMMHQNAMKAYKRSSIPTPASVDGEEKLAGIKKVR